ncbi:dUTP diphosphatase [Acidithiobacillus sp. CV18-2]|uniref:Deoxyuridine 5'-triphosphate nucleotidohydrolase n=1 Tax=Igneacidithiobacillus copahuensis TaxID=2724909 RepID=A0AAE2YNU1_9PROT|nr:dUTP diphosphatase [Igneacidithiobacillus copahuensis]MBU2755821.1 dUTP diphosphatase [Acidithiobacillus sp. CV18-3]MBU2756264.1 dUTP diphosphatase [Acidithiobacillus sp. BN09-2]MBU2777771.1 dUTP diphosphatase [Acidithiobacillus sp. CV18-2]MBU2795955.1 dUTP diphosphatase [Acidithiobacillus sp. VAN18-2]MBU2800493.1 dUTP diphosphatase [Acidithiobacillus sp. VAN18-4]UTV80411.1 dUTP diphosphatase [Acidithiobacillus sp. YTS05]
MDTLALRILDPRLGRDWPLPHYASDAAAGMDLRACIETPLTLAPGEAALISAGFAMHIGDPAVTALLLPRSGLGHKGLVLGNLVGLIDADYQGPLKVSLWNRGTESFTIAVGERVAQMILVPVLRPQVRVVEEFVASERGAGGFGSTGTH